MLRLSLRNQHVFKKTNLLAPLSRGIISVPPGGDHHDEIMMLEKLLEDARRRKSLLQRVDEQAKKDEKPTKPFTIGTFNAISPTGLKRFPPSKYRIAPMEEYLKAHPEIMKKSPEELEESGPHALLLRSFKLKSDNVPRSVRAIARCGAGVNNIDVAALTERGIPVFNTPGANANAVKELVICSMFLASRGIVQGIAHQQKIIAEEKGNFENVKKRVEKEKKNFGGIELQGKKLGVIGLGHIGAAVADTAIALGMDVIGYDPTIDVAAAWRLPGQVLQRASTLEELVADVDYVTLHVPYMKETHHLLDASLLRQLKPTAHIINFARGELVDTQSLRKMYDSGARKGMYVADFADQYLHDHPNALLMPHLGASTEEAENNSAEMAANQIMDFIETGSIRNSVNFPTVELPRPVANQARMCIVNKNVPGMLGLITTTLGGMGLNITQHINTSKENLAYNAVDLEGIPDDATILEMQKRIAKLEGVITSRVIDFQCVPSFYMVNDPEL